MSKIAITGAATGTATFTIESPATSTNRTLTIPDATTTIVGTDATQTLTNKSIVATQLTGTVAAARLPAGTVLQVVSNVNTSQFSTTSQTFVTTTQSLAITPSSASNKVLVMFNAGSVTTLAANTAIDIEVRRAGTMICKGGYYTATVSGNQTVPFGVIQSLDSPNTTSSVTYEVFAKEGALAGTVTVNADQVLTLMEIAG